MRIVTLFISLSLLWLGCGSALIEVSPIIPDTVFVFLDFDGYDIDTSLFQVLGAEYKEGDIIHISPSSFSHHREKIRELMSQHFTKVDRNFVFIFNPNTPKDLTVVFGGSNPIFLGLSWSNVAIVFTEKFGECNTLNEHIQAVANVGSHELGHLIGFGHTDNPDDIMSTGSQVGWEGMCKNSRQFIEEQPIHLPTNTDRSKIPEWNCSDD